MTNTARVANLTIEELDGGHEAVPYSLPADMTKRIVAPLEPLLRAIVTFEWRGEMPDEIKVLAERYQAAR